jgi:hypothetical protein
MNDRLTDKEAAKNLAKVKSTQDVISRSSAKEYAPWIGWGLFIILFYPPFDFIDPNKWGIITWAVAIAGSFVTARYFSKREAKIKTNRHAPRLSWLYYILWVAAGNVFALLTYQHFGYAWTVAGLVIGLPVLLYGLKLKSQT